MGFFDFLKKKKPPEPVAQTVASASRERVEAPPSAPSAVVRASAPQSFPFRAVVTTLTPDGVGTLTNADGFTCRFGATACRGWQPAVGVEVEVNGLDAHPLGGMRALDVRLVSDSETYSARFADTVTALQRRSVPAIVVGDLSFAQLPRPAAPPIRPVAPKPAELDDACPPNQRKVVTTRLENVRDGQLFFRELSWDGRLVRMFGGRSSLDTPDLIDEVFNRGGEKYATPEEARAAFERHVGVALRNFSSQQTSVTFVPVVELPTFVSNPELEAAFEHASAEMRGASAQVFADWLLGEGDLRGELASRGQNSSDTYAAAFLAANDAALLGEVDFALGSELLELKWSHGFLVGATLKLAHFESTTDLAKLTAQFLELPVARFVTELRFGLASFESDNDWTETLAAVVNSPRGPAITRLEFDDYTSEDCEISWTPFGDFSPFWSKLPALEWLHIRSGAGGTLGNLDLPNLKTFIRESGGLAEGELRSIIDAKWPKLERLDVWFGSDNYGAEGSVALVQPLLDGRGIEHVTHLGFVNCEFSSELLVATLQSKVLPKLKVLDFSKGILGDADVEVLLKNVDRLKHLERLDLSENLIDDVDRLKAVLPNAVVDDQRDDYDEEYRYCAVGE